MQRIIQAIILGLIMGLAGSDMIQVAFLLMLAMMVLLLIGGATGFCPGLMILKAILPSCNEPTLKDEN
jgi:hypothetical protein